MSLNSERFPLTSGLRNKNSENDGFKVILVCFVVFSVAITVALIVQIYYGEPEVSPHAAVSSDHKTCSTLGTDAVRRGGSAVDAAICAALCMSVVHPHTNGLGGGGFMLVHDHAGNSSWVVDFRETAPAATDTSANASHTGAGAVGTPGLLRGLQLAHAQHGRLPWAELVRPSVLLARQGTRVTEQLAAALSNHLTLGEAQASAGMSVFVSEAGRLLRAGDTLKLPDLADTLQQVETRGTDALYEGPVASAIVSELNAADGILTTADLSEYKPLQYEGLLKNYGNFSLLTSAAPSGGPALLTALGLVARANLSHAPSAGLHYHRVSEALRLSMARFSRLGDPGSSENVTAATVELLSAGSLASLSGEISDAEVVADAELPALDTPAATHVSVIDNSELYVSLVSGLGSYFGAKIRTSSGVLLNNAMAAFYPPALQSRGTLNVPAPGRRPLTTLSPAILMASKVCGRRVVTGGSDASLLAQAVIRLVDPVMKENLTSSLEGPRLHTAQDSHQLGIEADRLLQLPGPAVASLKDMGHTTFNEARPYPSCNGVTKLHDQLSSHADSRGGGTAVRF